jgi:hypothetical protein
VILQDAFTNRALAENRTWLSAVAYVECPFCHFLSHNAELDKTSAPCPNCAASGKPRIIFPGLSSHRLLEMVAYFYARSCERLDDLKNELLRTLSEQLGCSFEWNAVVQTVVAIHKFRREQGRIDTPETFEQLLGTIQTSLGLKTTEDARTVFPSLFGYSDTTEEHQAIVLLVAAMLEKLFKELLSRMLRMVPLSENTVKYVFKKSRGHADREQLFAALTGKRLETLITSTGSPEFYSKWQSIRDVRNEFMHGSSFAIGANAAEVAFDIAKESFRVFAELHNEFCIQRT